MFRKSLVFKSQQGKAQPDWNSFPSLKAGISGKDGSAGKALAVLQSGGLIPFLCTTERARPLCTSKVSAPRKRRQDFWTTSLAVESSRVSE